VGYVPERLKKQNSDPHHRGIDLDSNTALTEAAYAAPSAIMAVEAEESAADASPTPKGSTTVLRKKREFLETVASMKNKDPVAAIAASLLLWRLPAALRAARATYAPMSAKDLAKELMQKAMLSFMIVFTGSVATVSAAASAASAALTGAATSVTTASGKIVSKASENVDKITGKHSAEYLATLSSAPKKKWQPPSGYVPSSKRGQIWAMAK
jgi:hypothetical protein